MATGVLFVTIIGVWRKRKSYVSNSGIMKPLLPPDWLLLVKEMVTYGWSMRSAKAMKVRFLIVRMQGTMFIHTIANTTKMHQSSAGMKVEVYQQVRYLILSLPESNLEPVNAVVTVL